MTTTTESSTKAQASDETQPNEGQQAPGKGQQAAGKGQQAAGKGQQALGDLAVIYTPELGEASLQSCRGGALAWAFGPVNNPTTLRLSPGLNAPVPRDLWERAKAQPVTQALIGRGLIQEIELADGAANDDGEMSLAALPVQTAVRLIYGCRNSEQLEQWLRREDRQQLRERLAGRIKEIADGRP